MQGKAVESVLKLDHIAFENIRYSRNVNVAFERTDIQMNFTRSIQSSEDKKNYRISLTANLWSEPKGLVSLEITAVGFFSCDCEDERLKETLVSDNAVAIIFPYLRSQVSLVTTQPDLPPITLPSMNIAAMFHENEKQE